MTVKDFNEKYSDFLESRFYGLEINSQEFIEWLDLRFQEFIKKPGFSFSQIKEKFGAGRFYCEGLSDEEVREVEEKISILYKIQE